MDSDKLASMYAEIVNGVTKAKSRFAKDKESKALWDEIFSEVVAMRKAHPKGTFEIPNEMP